jgi:ActR/RegA family two-component response regulator
MPSSYNDNDHTMSGRSWRGGAPSALPVLAAEPGLADARRLAQCLARRRLQVRLAMSPADVLDLLRREIFDRAVVAVEMTLDGEPVLARVARLPMLRRVVAVGPAGDPEAEVRARLAGAHVYLPRPVDEAELARALALPGAVVNPG